jgi:nitrite reductase/ring-hydroxylating ferredoxin subunit
LFSAYLGGHLVFQHKIGVDHAKDDTGPEDFVPVLPVTELVEGRLRRAEVRGTPILLVRRGEQIFALAETCAHLGGPLSEGWLVEDTVVCPWHQSRYRLSDGHVVDGPSTYDQPCLQARVRNGQVEVRKAPAGHQVQPPSQRPGSQSGSAQPQRVSESTPAGVREL